MELQHTFTVPAPVDQAWSTLLDVEGIAPCFPGAALTGVDGDSFSGTVKVKLGPVSLQYAGKGRFLERDEAARHVVLEANGSDKRGNGTAGATVHARLEPLGDSETRVVVDTDLKVTGRPAQFGRGVLQDVGGRIIEQFATCLATRMAAPSEPAPTEPTAQDEAGGPALTVPSEEPTAATAASARAAEGITPPSSSTAGSSTTSSSTRSSSTTGSSTTSSSTTGSSTTSSSTTSSSTTGSSTTSPSTPARPSPDSPAPAAELDLNAVVLPALARRYGPALLAVLLALIVVRLIVRRRR